MKKHLASRAARYALRTASNSVRYGRDAVLGTYTRETPETIARLTSTLPIETIEPHRDALLALANLTLAHRFDLLGSGWVELTPGSNAVNLSNRSQSQAIRAMIDPAYQAIDWHSDFKSDYHWNSRTWHRHIRYEGLAGVDVKVPWELARMQHLPRLALACCLKPDDAYRREFRNQVLDFASSNPPRFGVNWYCAMDVAIRAANILLAFDLFRAHGAKFDIEFQDTLAKSALEHGRFVRAHLERHGNVRNNHYLAGIAGLIFIAASLPGVEASRWLHFATGELIREVHCQFQPDGSNFEGSTSYHRLSSEMVYFSTALLLGLPDPPAFPSWYCERLARMAEFTKALTLPDGTVPQIGDNDSGRFFHLTPMYRRTTVREARSQYVHLRRYEAQNDNCEYWDGNDQDHSHLLAAARGLFFPESPTSLEAAIIQGLSQGRTLPLEDRHRIPEEWSDEPVRFEGHKQPVCSLLVGDCPVVYRAFPDFGVYIYSNQRFFLTIRCGGSRGSHAHDDHLSIELHDGQQTLYRDPGTYVYTPHPALRRRYRSLAAHAVPYPLEHASDAPVFGAREMGHSECRFATKERFVGFGEFGEGCQAYRCIEISGGKLQITDYLSRLPRPDAAETVPYSPGYGKLSSEWVRGGQPRREEVPVCV